MSPNLDRCYEVLAVSHNSTWTEIRAAYRQLAQKWHPDRVGEEQKAEAEKRIKEINQAFSDIEKYYVKFGKPPGDTALKNPPPNQTVNRQARPGTTTRKAPQQEREESRPLKPHMVFLLLCVVGYLAWFLFWPAPEQDTLVSDPASETATQENTTDTEQDAEQTQQVRLFFKVGSSETEVYGIQGRPGRIKGDLWYYGGSVIFFSDGAVIGWHEDPEFPLYTEERARRETAAADERP
ncbi:MAG TPA: J domain-containing protein [Gammaproteobacteria bacterium]|nr:J domain-containing protein [Gammaproteobacteria bacterium]